MRTRQPEVARFIGEARVVRSSDRRGFWTFVLATLAIYAGVVVLGALVGKTAPSDQTHYAYLAQAFLQGRLDIDPAQAPHLTEVIPYNGKSYVCYPPMPAVVLMPFVALFGPTLPMSAVSILIASYAVGLCYLVLRRAGFTAPVGAWVTVVFGFGTAFWYTSLKGSSWHFAHVTGVVFLLGALWETFGRSRPLLIGLCLGAATLCRLPIVLATPVFLYLVTRNRAAKGRRAALLLAGVGLFIGLNMAYNWVRYQTIFDVGYHLIPGVLEERWYTKGIFDLSYLPRNLWLHLFGPPLLIDRFPYVVPSQSGLALFLATPVLLLMFRASNGWLTWSAALGALLVSIPSLLHGSSGDMQFGFRFSIDYSPFLLLLVAQGLRGSVTPRVKALVALNCLIGLWGLAFMSPIEPPWLFPFAGAPIR